MWKPFGLFVFLIVFGLASSDLPRSVDFATCLDSFDIHEDKIIRTEDSKAIGAKYLNERDVSSRDDCKRLCCETDSCDVFVFEEKNPGSCYLFQCGPSEYFKCKFTKHQNYTSAVLAINRQLTELESQIKLTQHEHELTKLREPPKPDLPLPTAYKPTTQASKTKEIAEFPLDNGSSQKKGCRKYQFECHTSKECIAIYNACDGITQCADGSDEAPELGCPTSSTAASVKIAATPVPVRIHDPPPESYPVVEGRNRVDNSVSELQNQWQQRQQFVDDPQLAPNSNSLPQSLPVGSNSRVGYGREGEMMNYRQDPQYHQYRPGQSQIFTHKGNGLVPQSDHYQHPYSPPETSKGNYNEQPNELPKYYYENTQYRVFPQNQPPANWQPGRRTHEGPPLEDGPNRVEPQIPPNSPDYYYEESYRNRQPYSQGQQPGYRQMNPPYQGKAPIPQADPKTVSSEQKIETTVAPTSAPKESAVHNVKNSHMKVEKLSAESKIKEVSIDAEIDGHSTNPSGAILSLTMGLCITVIMVVLVGCRMRMVPRRMRRGGKSSYAHDADFLVNGMYL